MFCRSLAWFDCAASLPSHATASFAASEPPELLMITGTRTSGASVAFVSSVGATYVSPLELFAGAPCGTAGAATETAGAEVAVGAEVFGAVFVGLTFVVLAGAFLAGAFLAGAFLDDLVAFADA